MSYTYILCEQLVCLLLDSALQGKVCGLLLLLLKGLGVKEPFVFYIKEVGQLVD